MRLDSYWLLLFQIPAWICFLFLIAWYECIPVGHAVDYVNKFPNILHDIEASAATCFFVDHGKVWFLSYPDLNTNRSLFILILFIFLLIQTLTIKPFLRFKNRVR